MKNIPSMWNKNFFSISFDSKEGQGDSTVKMKNPAPQTLSPSASMEAIDNNRFFYGSQ
jgi:hypothetical protein